MSDFLPAQTFEDALNRVQRLVADFRAGAARYLNNDYQEAEARGDFIDKFLITLGWDVRHDVQRNPFEQEVKVEKPVQAGQSQRRADYAFHIAPNYQDVRFVLEAKKPALELAVADNYFQVVRYGWYKQNPLAWLTNFTELHLLDSRYKPNIHGILSRYVRKYHFTDYADPEKFAEIYWLLSRQAVADGALEKYAATLPSPRGAARQRKLFPGGYQNIDESFLAELDEYRLELARGFKKQHPELDSATLTELTQRTLDRLVFMRFLEDKGIEPEYFVANFGYSGPAWREFVSRSHRLDVVYNGTVFKRHAILDAPDFDLDDAVFRPICHNISHENTSYDFNEIPLHILGSIYERFLANVIVATDKRVRIEQRPEVRRAGGIYYTPAYVVRYIVSETVGKLIDGKTPAQIAKMRFADIACGSGSFLLEVYNLLLRYHSKYYNDHRDEAKSICVEKDGVLRLGLDKKRAILLQCIYGSDIDHQAVEVTELSLYLKLLEEETIASADEYRSLFHATLLPSLSSNIVCGNSVIGTDILSGSLFPDETNELNPMDFEDRFPRIVGRKGFDVVLGNPPYVRPHKLTPLEKEYFWDHYSTFTHKSDLYCCFMERATALLRTGGLFSYIVSHGWLRLNSFRQLRRHVLDNYSILKIVELPYQVFRDASVVTCMFVFQKNAEGKRAANVVQVLEGCLSEKGPEYRQLREIPQKIFTTTFQNVFDLSIAPETEKVKDKMRRGPKIGKLFDVRFGLKTGDDERFLHHEKGKNPEDKPLLRGDDVKRYGCQYKGEFVYYVPREMRRHRSTARPGEPWRFEQPKVLVKDTSADFGCTFDDQNFYVKDVLIVLPNKRRAPDLRFVTGIINSKAMYFYYRTTFRTLHVQNEELSSLPLPMINLRKAAEKAAHDRLVQLVERQLEATARLVSAKSDRDKNLYNNQSLALDRNIDALVYELYGLGPDDVRIVEAALAELPVLRQRYGSKRGEPHLLSRDEEE